MVCRSVGWLMHEGPECKVIVPHWSQGTNEGCGDMVIPTRAVIRLVDLPAPALTESQTGAGGSATSCAAGPVLERTQPRS